MYHELNGLVLAQIDYLTPDLSLQSCVKIYINAPNPPAGGSFRNYLRVRKSPEGDLGANKVQDHFHTASSG